MRAPSRRWSWRSCAGRGRRPARPGSRTRSRRFRATKRSCIGPIRAGRLATGDLDAAQELVDAARHGAGAARRHQAHAIVHRDRRAACAGARARLSRDDGGAEPAFAGRRRRRSWREAFEEIAEQQRRLRASRPATTPTCSRPRSRTAPAAAPDGPARACASSAPLEARLVQRRPRGARRAGRGRVAAGDAQRSVAVAADAARARARSARAARRPVGARLRAAARHARGHPDARREARAARRRSRRASRSGSRRSPARRMESRADARRAVSRTGRAISTAPTTVEAGGAPAAAAAARCAAEAAERHRDRGSGCAIPTRSMRKHILKLRPLDAVDTPPGARDRGTVIHGAIGDFTEKYAKGLPADPLGALTRARREAFRAAAGLSGGARVLVAALPAHRALVHRLGGAAARQCERAACRGAARTADPDRQARLSS